MAARRSTSSVNLRLLTEAARPITHSRSAARARHSTATTRITYMNGPPSVKKAANFEKASIVSAPSFPRPALTGRGGSLD